MMEKAAVGRPRPMRSRWIATAALALFVVLLLIGGKAGAPYLFQGATLQSELATQVRLTTGLVVTARDHGRFDLLPRPHIVMKGLHFADPTGALTVEADALEGDVRLLPLLVGRIELEAATLVRPRLAVDFDGQPLQPDSTIGRTMRPGTRTGPAPSGRLGVVTLVDGTVSVKSRMLRSMTEFHDVDVTIDWPDIDSPATLTGSFTVHDVAADVAIWLAQPSSLMRGETSPLALRVKSTPLDLSANGDLAVAGSTTFRGHVAMRAPSLGGILALAGTRMPLPAPFSDLALNSDVGIEIDRDGRPAVDLSSLRLHLDGNDYEGALALQDSATPTIAGTLATDQLAVAPFIDRMPRLLDARRQWSRDPLDVARIDPIALDLRISASHLRLAPFTIDDAALAIMTRSDRTEIVLADGKAYGGDVRARASVGIAGDALSLRGMGTLAGADAATLSWDALGRQVATGSLSGSASFDAMGPSPAALIEHLNGSIDARVNGGEFSLLDLGRGLRASDARRLESAMPSIGSARAPFRDLSFGLRLVDGSATLEDAVLHGTALTMKATGAVDLPARELHVAVAASPAGETGEGAGKPLRIELGGSFDKILVTIPPERAGH